MSASIASGSGQIPAWCQPRGFLLLLTGYSLTHLVLRLWVSPTLTIDDAREALFAQTLEWGYQPRQPPLYNWLVWGAFRLLGVGVHGLTLVKYLLLFFAYLFIYLSARRFLTDARLPCLAAFSLLMMVPLNWVVHEALTHSIAVLAASAATSYVLLRVEASGSLGAYAVLGLTLALGLLSKFSYSLFAGALLIAALTVARFRIRILTPRMLLALGVTALLLLPYLVWFYQNDFSLGRIYTEEVDPGPRESYLQGVASALYYIARVTLYYVTPLWLVFLVLFRGVLRAPAAAPGAALSTRRLLARFFLAGLGILLIGALFGGLTYLKFRWMIPAFFLFPLYVFSRMDGQRIEDRRIKQFAMILLITELAIIVALIGNVYRGDRFGRPSRLNTPYDVVAERLAAAGFMQGTIAAGEGALGGNLRLRFPTSRVIRLTNPGYVPPTSGHGQCLIVWEKGPDDTVPAEMRRWLASALELNLTGGEPVRVVEAKYHFSAARSLRVRYVLLPEGAGRCR